jgi:hypothetical protein
VRQGQPIARVVRRRWGEATKQGQQRGERGLGGDWVGLLVTYVTPLLWYQLMVMWHTSFFPPSIWGMEDGETWRERCSSMTLGDTEMRCCSSGRGAGETDGTAMAPHEGGMVHAMTHWNPTAIVSLIELPLLPVNRS